MIGKGLHRDVVFRQASELLFLDCPPAAREVLQNVPRDVFGIGMWNDIYDTVYEFAELVYEAGSMMWSGTELRYSHDR